MIPTLNRWNFDDYIAMRTRGFTGRGWVFAAVARWLRAGEPRAFLLTGEPGIGKSAIAARLVQISRGEAPAPKGCGQVRPGFLSACHFCFSRYGGWITAEGFARSLGTQLAARFPEYARAVAPELRIDVRQSVETNLGSMVGVAIENYYAESPRALFDALVRQPLIALYAKPQNEERIVLLVDGLDEALSPGDRLSIVQLLAECGDLPLQVRLLLTARPVADVLEPLQPLAPFVLDAARGEHIDDVRAYVRGRISAFATPGAADIGASVAERSRGNFLVASLLLDEVEKSGGAADGLPGELEHLYGWYLRRLTGGEMDRWRHGYRPVLGLLTAAREPVSAQQLIDWGAGTTEAVHDALSDLRALVDPTMSGRYGLYHDTLAAFLTGPQAGSFRLDAATYHRHIADYCLARSRESDGDRTPWDGYALRHLPTHLAAAGDTARLHELLLDPHWIAAKLAGIDVVALTADYDLTPHDKSVQLVGSALDLSADILERDPTQLKSQLNGRLLSSSQQEIKRLRDGLALLPGAWLRLHTAMLCQAGDALIRKRGHKDAVWGMSISADGQWAVSASKDNTLKVWEIDTDTCLRTLTGHSNSVTGVAMIGDGKCVVSTSYDRTLKLWEVATGTCLRTLVGHLSIVTDLAVTQGGEWIISSSWDNTLKVWAVATGTCLRTLVGHTHIVRDVAVTPDGRWAVSASHDTTLKVWEIATGKCWRTLIGHKDWVNSVAITDDGQWIVSASCDNTLKVWEMTTGTCLHTLAGHTEWISDIALTVDGQWAVSVSRDGTLKVWELATGNLTMTLTGDGHVLCCACGPDGLIVAGDALGRVHILELVVP